MLGRVRPGFHGHVEPGPTGELAIDLNYIILMCDRFGEEQRSPDGGVARRNWWHLGAMAEGLRLAPDWQPECCVVCACAYDPSYMRLLDVVVIGWTSDAFAPAAGVHRCNQATRGPTLLITLPRVCQWKKGSTVLG